MHTVPTTTVAPTRSGFFRRPAVRWMASFAGFPLGGLAAKLIVGPVDTTTAAVAGGLLSGAILGSVQSWALGRHGPPARQWIAATAVGFLVGLGIGATVVDFDTTLGALVVQGAICGLSVGAAQALVLRPRLGRLALAWPGLLAAIWAGAWAITYSAGIQVDEQFTVFGSSGAIVATALTAVLPLALSRREAGAS